MEMITIWAIIALCMLSVTAANSGGNRQHSNRFNGVNRHMTQGLRQGRQFDENEMREHCEELTRLHQLILESRDNPDELEQYRQQLRQHYRSLQENGNFMSHHRMPHHRMLDRMSHGGMFQYNGRHMLMRHHRGMGHHICDQYVTTEQSGRRRKQRNRINRRTRFRNEEQDVTADSSE